MASPPTTPSTDAPGTRRRALVLLGLLLGLITWAGVVGGTAPAASAAVTPGGVACEARAGAATVAVVVDFGGGRVRSRCVEPGGSGIEVLRRAGFAPVTYGYASEGGDAAVCAVRDPDTGTVQGCQSGPSCLTCLEPESWAYFPGYRYSSVGAGGSQPRAGTVEAWRWGSSTDWGGARTSHADVCGAPEPEPTPTTAPPATRPSGGGGGGATPVPVPGDPAGDGAGGAGGGGGADGPGGPGGTDPAATPGASSTTGPGASSTTTAEPGSSSTTEAAAVDTDTADRPSQGDDGDRDDEQRADGLPAAATGDPGGGGGGGPPVVPLVVTALVVVAVAALAVRARRSRAADDPTPA